MSTKKEEHVFTRVYIIKPKKTKFCSTEIKQKLN